MHVGSCTFTFTAALSLYKDYPLAIFAVKKAEVQDSLIPIILLTDSLEIVIIRNQTIASFDPLHFLKFHCSCKFTLAKYEVQLFNRRCKHKQSRRADCTRATELHQLHHHGNVKLWIPDRSPGSFNWPQRFISNQLER